MYAKEDLPDGDGRAPVLLLVQDGQADGAAGVDVWVEERARELAFGGFGRVVFREGQRQLVRSSLPRRSCFARHASRPGQEIERPVRCFDWLCKEAKRVVFPPLLLLLLQSIPAEAHCWTCAWRESVDSVERHDHGG